MAPTSHKEIVVDGIRYDIASGKAVGNSPITRRNIDNVAAPTHAAQRHPASEKSITLARANAKPMGVIELPQSRRQLKKQARAKNVANHKTKPVSKVQAMDLPGFGYYFWRSLLPSGFSASSWIFIVLRGVTSPTAWLLTALPLIILQAQNLVNENLNQLLSKVHIATQNGRIFGSTSSILLAVILSFGIIFARVILNAMALHLRLELLGERAAKLWPAAKVVMHNSIKILLHGTIQITWALLTSFAAATVLYWLLLYPHAHTLEAFAPYIAASVIFVWATLLCMLHAKHWLQTAILSTSLKTNSIQSRSWAAMLAFPLRSGILGAISFALSASVIVYGLWVALKTVTWLSRASVPSNGQFALLIGSIFLAAVLVGYLQQTLWGAYASWLNTQLSPCFFELPKRREIARITLWPIWVSIYIVVMCMAVASLGIIYVLPAVNMRIILFSQKLPSKIEIPKLNK